MKKMLEKIKKMSLPVKIQLVIAIMCTAAIPVYAWFAYQNKIEALTKIKEPPSINLASGGDDPALYISLENIDVTAGSEKYVVFSVESGHYSAYDIQLSHTTNIPFTYELYRVKEDKNGTIEYTDHTRVKDAETELKYSVISDLTDSITTSGKIKLTNVNSNSSNARLGDEDKLAVKGRRNYDTENDNVNQYVKPLYSIARKIPKLTDEVDDSEDRDYFAIKLIWSTVANMTEDNAAYWNYAFNNKETDIIYISAKESSVD